MPQTLTYTIDLPAKRDRVWHLMLDDASYRDWTTAFHPGSYYEGEWKTGATMLFLGPEGGGMRAVIEAAEFPSYVSIAHKGEVKDGKAVDGPDWEGAFERYRLSELPGGHTRLDVSLSEVPEAYVDMMNQMWPKALERLRQMCAAQ
jgi:hypothetical protein